MTKHQHSLNSAKNLTLFICVGVMATTAHYSVALLTHYSLGQVNELYSNLLGFTVAFPVSYLGHRYWTFNQTKVSHRQALRRFFTIALLGLVTNQSLLWWGITTSLIPFWLLLGFVLLITSAITYLLSKAWVFKQ